MQQTFAAATSWTMAHPWGSTHPYVIATNLDGSRTYIVGPEFTDGQVTVTFGRATAGVLELLNPMGSGTGSLVDDTTGPAIVGPRGSAGITGGTAADLQDAIGAAEPAAILETGQGAVIR